MVNASLPRDTETSASVGSSGGGVSAPVRPGDVVAGKYRIDRMIGFGGMGVVCAGAHLELGTKVAVKFVRLEYAADERVVARFLSEARSAAQLRSEHTCRVMDCGRLQTGNPYLVMEYLEGADLRRILSAQGCMPVEEAVSFVLQACEALAEAHASGIVHRDVKPENLFLTHGPDGGALVKVLDFGISKQLGRAQESRALTERSDSVGSPHHMSPEQMTDPTTVDARTDIWSLGVLLYELLTGELPFKGDSMPQVCANVMTAHPASPRYAHPEIPEGLAEVVLRCLDKNREGRFPDVAALGRALKDFGGPSSTVAAARVQRILERALLTGPGPPSAVNESRLVPAGSRDRIEEAPLPIPGLPRRSFGTVFGVLLALVAASAGGFHLWQNAHPATEASPASRSETAAPLQVKGTLDEQPPIVPPLEPTALRPESVPVPAPAHEERAPPTPTSKPTPLSRVAAKPARRDTSGAAAKSNENPFPAGTSVYPEPKAPEFNSPNPAPATETPSE